MATTLPAGWKLDQVKAEQPATTYADFKREILNEIARCINMPYNVAAANSAKYNYASGRLDHQVYHRAILIDRSDLEANVLARLFDAWISEAVLIEGYLPQQIRSRDADLSHQWFWDGFKHVDPQKEATAEETRLKNNTTTYAAVYAEQGKDWEVELRQAAKEKALRQELGLDVEPAEQEVEDAAV